MPFLGELLSFLKAAQKAGDINSKEQAFEAVSKEKKELAYEQFFRLHMIVRALHLVNVGLAFSLFILKNILD